MRQFFIASLVAVVTSSIFACEMVEPSDAAPKDTSGDASDTSSPDAGNVEDASDAADLPGVDVHGKLIDILARPVAGAKVVTAVTTTPVVTGADGTFTVKASPPYDLVATTPSGDQVIVVVGLTRVDPIVSIPTSVSPRAYATFSGAMPAIAAGQGARVIFEPTDGKSRFSDYAMSNGPTAAYERVPEWHAPGPFTGTMHLFQYTTGASNPAATFLGYSKVENATADKDETTTIDFPALTPVQTGTISGVMTVPDGWSKGGSLFAFLRTAGSKARLTVNQSTSSDLSFSLPVPEMTDATYGIAFRASGTKSGEQSIVRKVVALGETANVTMPASATVSAPAEGATNVDAETELSWSKVDGVAHVMGDHTSGEPSATAPLFHIITAGASAKLPNLAPFGAAFESGKTYAWRVVHYPLIATSDALTAKGDVDWYCIAASPIGSDEAQCLFSEQRTFVTK